MQHNTNEVAQQRALVIIIDRYQYTFGLAQQTFLLQFGQATVVLVGAPQLFDIVVRLKGISRCTRIEELIGFSHQESLSMVAGNGHVLIKVKLRIIHSILHLGRKTFQGIVAALHTAITLIDFRPHIGLSRGFQGLDTLMVGLVGLMVRSRHHVDTTGVHVAIADVGCQTLDDLVIFLGFIEFLGRVAGGQHCTEQQRGNQSEIFHGFSVLILLVHTGLSTGSSTLNTNKSKVPEPAVPEAPRRVEGPVYYL